MVPRDLRLEQGTLASLPYTYGAGIRMTPRADGCSLPVWGPAPLRPERRKAWGCRTAGALTRTASPCCLCQPLPGLQPC